MGRFHAAAIVGVEEVEVVALAEPSPEALAQASAIVPGAATYPVIGDALAHPGLEAVLVAAPTSLHPPIVEAALSAGMHVLCEKPLALDLDDARRLAALAHDRGARAARSGSGAGSRRRGGRPRSASTRARSGRRSTSASRSGTVTRRRPRSAIRRSAAAWPSTAASTSTTWPSG